MFSTAMTKKILLGTYTPVDHDGFITRLAAEEDTAGKANEAVGPDSASP